MTPPISIGSDVVVVGPTEYGNTSHIGEKFTVASMHQESSAFGGRTLFCAKGLPWYPASSLRLVEGLKIGNWVEVIGPCCSVFITRGDDLEIFKIGYRLETGCYGYDCGRPSYPASSLRKLTPEEIAMHTGTIGYQAQKCNAELEKAKEALRDLLAPLVDERLSAIESRLNELGPSHADLLGDVEALAEKMGATEKRQKEQHERIDRFMQDYREHKDFDFDMHDRIKVLEGEMSEVIDCPKSHRMSNDESICVSIYNGLDKSITKVFTCPNEAREWIEKVLDSMKEA